MPYMALNLLAKYSVLHPEIHGTAICPTAGFSLVHASHQTHLENPRASVGGKNKKNTEKFQAEKNVKSWHQLRLITISPIEYVNPTGVYDGLQSHGVHHWTQWWCALGFFVGEMLGMQESCNRFYNLRFVKMEDQKEIIIYILYFPILIIFKGFLRPLMLGHTWVVMLHL